jgi:SAM-dependent methyltransferase
VGDPTKEGGNVATGNLSTEAEVRYAFIRQLMETDGVRPPASVIELGAAPGDQISELSTRGYRATAVDIGLHSDEWGDGESGRMLDLFEKSGVNYVQWNLEEAPYPLKDNSYDAVIMTEVYEHLRDYPVKSLQEVNRILRPGGTLYFTTPNAAYLMNRFRMVAGQNVQSSLADWIGGVPFARHAREYTFREAHELMKYASLEVVLSTSRHFQIQDGRQDSRTAITLKRGLDRLARLRPELGPEIVIVARKRSHAR